MGEKEEAAPAAADDVIDGMQCSDHPFRSNPGGICAFCLQDKLGKLVSSASPSNSFFPPAATSSATSSSTSSSDFPPRINNKQTPLHRPPSAAAAAAVLALKRSKSVAPRPVGDVTASVTAESPRRKGFWSFLLKRSTEVQPHTTTAQMTQREDESTSKKNVDQDLESPSGGSQASSSSFGRKVARSRSVGCGSRSFSGDFLERISTGFGDCTLRRVESQRENGRHVGSKIVSRRDNEGRIKERVKCGGIFGGFGMMSSSTSYWLSAATAAGEEDDDFGSTSSRMSATTRRNKNWGWAFASPMRAFKPASTTSAVASINSSTGRIANPPSSVPVIAIPKS